MTQEDSKERKDSFIAYSEDDNWNNDESIDKCKCVKCILKVQMWTVWKELLHYTVLSMSWVQSHDQILSKRSMLH